MMINTTLGPMDESLLQYRYILIDNENEHTESMEYCLLDCDGEAHKTGMPDSAGNFCNKHVHRSAKVGLKKGLILEGEVGKLS